MRTPWGPSQTVETLERGVNVVTTATHGGIIVEQPDTHGLDERAEAVGHSWSNGLAFEEDCAVNAVFACRPDLYRKLLETWGQEVEASDAELRERAEKRLARWYPDLTS